MTRPSARHVLPEMTERTSSGLRTQDPYSKLLEERIVLLGTQVDDTAANDVMAQFMYLEHKEPDRDISLYVNSPGGSYSAMTAIYDTMRYVSCDVETICLGQAGATAAVLLAAGTPGKRLALPGARIVLHQPALAEPVEGQASDLAIRAEELLRTRAPPGGDAGPAHRARAGAGERGHRARPGPHRPGGAGVRAGGPDRARPHGDPRPADRRVRHRCCHPNCPRCPR
jgi:ATP-dependent Clp protease protease subunit